MNAESDYLLGADGLKLFYQYWLPEKTEQILCVIHGHGEHSGRYGYFASHMVSHNIAVLAMDLRGHGLSNGKRGHAPSYESLMTEVEELLKTAREMFNDIPLFLYGHSMGGNLVANFMIQDKSSELSGFILSSPWFKLAFNPPKIKVKLGEFMAKIWPAFSEHNGLNIQHLSKDPIEVKKYADDPLVHGMISAGLFGLISKASANALQNSQKIKVRGLVFHGSMDHIIDYTATETFAGSNERITWKLLDGVYHEPHNDLEKDDVLKMVCDWIKEK
jgi:alpha-beta hydrolase superfamily lysophospholipase